MNLNQCLTGIFCACIASIPISAHSVTVIPSDYMIAGSVGDTWTYENLDSSQFTWTLSEVTSGPNTGAFERGDDSSGWVYDLSGTDLTILELNKVTADPSVGLVFSETELGQTITLNDDPVDPSQYLLWLLPEITVQAGTFNDVLALVWLDDNFGSNAANAFLGIDSSITTSGITDVDFFVQGVGQVAFQGIDAATGFSDGSGFELVSTTVVPVPAAIWLFGTGLIGLLGMARRKVHE